ncbi:hypothetical protein E4U21_005957 [Claviceps maximensis]|nr:hypothetical protein E4U21_005957 [Claviceps maximensis]
MARTAASTRARWLTARSPSPSARHSSVPAMAARALGVCADDLPTAQGRSARYTSAAARPARRTTGTVPARTVRLTGVSLPEGALARPAPITTATSTARASGTAVGVDDVSWMGRRKGFANNCQAGASAAAGPAMASPATILTTACTLPAEHGKDYCASHLCEMRSCREPRAQGFDYCVEHKCHVQGCHRLRKRHTPGHIASFAPMNAPWLQVGCGGGHRYGYCDFHNCKFGKGCDNMVSEHEAFCWRHSKR